MSLPTPPSTSHRDKENRAPRFSTGSRVVWSEENQYHTLTLSPPRRLSVEASASKRPPARSILKKIERAVLPLDFEEETKETTPEPPDPLADLAYLENPVSRVIAPDATLRDLIEAYSVLAARIRACVPGNTDVDCSWPLFQPLRKNSDAFVDAVTRDLGRVLIDPVEAIPSDNAAAQPLEERFNGLPSPKESPKKKRGMSEEQVKFARDLSTASSTVMRFLSLMFTLPAVYQIFSHQQLGFMLTSVLAIPLANELPTPNARKTWATSMWLLQTQRLPAEVLLPARDRITFALRRGIEGELGKEGKKGSANDGLKAIHDLSRAYPDVFVPAFAEILPSILEQLLAPTLVLRSQACLALGGFSFAVAGLPQSILHSRISNIVALYLTTTQDATVLKGPVSPTKDPAIIRTLRTVLVATEPQHAAQGPVWAFCVLASLIVLLGPRLYQNDQVLRTMHALFSCGTRHPKSSVRALGCLVWRCMVWAYFHEPLEEIEESSDDDYEEKENTSQDEKDGEASQTEVDPEKAQQLYQQRMDSVWKIVHTIIDMGAGVSIIGALLGTTPTDSRNLKRALNVLRLMSLKGGHTCKDALDTAVHLVSMAEVAPWEPCKLLTPGLFSSSPGLLTADYKLLAQTVKPLFEDCAQVEDVRALTQEELSKDWVFSALLKVWQEGISALKLPWGTEIPTEILDVWFGLLRAPVEAFKAANDEEGLTDFAYRCVKTITSLIEDPELELAVELDEPDSILPTSPAKPGSDRVPQMPSTAQRRNMGVKLYLARELWHISRGVFPPPILSKMSVQMLTYLVHEEAVFIGNGKVHVIDEVHSQYATLCSEVAFASTDISLLDDFWSDKLDGEKERLPRKWTAEMRSAVWHTFVLKWNDGEVAWQHAIAVLGVPFMDMNAWDMSTDDVETWDRLLRATIAKALDDGIDSVSVIDQVAAQVSSYSIPTFSSSTRVADLLLSHLEITEARQVPVEVFEFVNNTLVSTYPPEPRNKVESLWLIRSLSRVIDTCPPELQLSIFDLLQDGLSLWIADDYQVFAMDVYAMDVMPVYQTILLAIRSLPEPLRTLEVLAPLVESAFNGRQDKLEAAKQAFEELWQASYASMPEPPCGWPERIQTCLQIMSGEGPQTQAGLLSKAETDEEEESNDSLFALTDSDNSENDELEVSAALYSPRSPSSPLPPSSPIPEDADDVDEGEDECTPRSTPRAPPATPTRGRPDAPRSLARLPSLLETMASPRRAPKEREVRTPRRLQTSARRASVQDKENAAPRLPGSALGKRRGEEAEDSDAEVPQRKRSRRVGEADGAADERAGASRQPTQAQPSTLVGEPAGDADADASSSGAETEVESQSEAESESEGEPEETCASSATPTPGSRKRKSEVFDGVEVPTLRLLGLQRRVSLLLSSSPGAESESESESEGVDASPTARAVGARAGSKLVRRMSTPAAKAKRTLRRTRSVANIGGADENATPQQMESPTKRRRSAGPGRVAELRAEAASAGPVSAIVLSSPLPAHAPVVGSDDSVMLASPTKLAADLSSDDDPHMGQVAPFGVTSPALRRARQKQTDPPSSDDSASSASPVREHVKRRLARMPSNSSIKSGSSSAGGAQRTPAALPPTPTKRPRPMMMEDLVNWGEC
ncbi:hypothetical protein WOLCODRAFT_136726 [Wolfiporia cocos MD-104 SS10]|uniref:Telomere-associated protein Rif1 N-terminal domain-containing protein n=1 Tax=Wolfiporia cocos (strain MD-104) TaxID=742152 RepID=A0A2H3JR33_WOLCO|nr:hypothetical protein WOLCODRAFT_136726 [Wolfiporia cocos MD-104 SS10]